MDLHFILRITSAWPKFVRLSDTTLGNPGLGLQRMVFSSFAPTLMTVCAQPVDQLDELIKTLNFFEDDTVQKTASPFDGVSDDSMVFLFDGPAYLDEASVVAAMDALRDRPDRSYQLSTSEGRPLAVYVLMGSEAPHFQIKKTRMLAVPKIYPLSTIQEFHTFREMVRHTVLQRHIENGVLIQAPESVVIDQNVVIAPGTYIGAGAVLRGHTTVGGGCKIMGGTRLDSCKIGENCTIDSSQLVLSTLESNVTVGPYSYLRPGCYVCEGAHIGSFVEIKNTRVGAHSKVPHLSYVGDTEMGEHVNVGGGVIIANYNGVSKHTTKLEDRAFVGSNSVLMAPVTIGEGAMVAAASAITEDIPPYSLGIGRARQINKQDWVRDREKNL